MPVNFNMLAPIAAPKVVGSVSPSNNQNDLNSLAGGLMTGFQQGQQIAGNALQMAAQRQQMDQASELFPLQKQNAEQTIEKNAMEIAAAKQQQQTAAEMRANFKQSWDQGMQWLAQNDPVKYQELQIKGAEYEKNIAAAAKDSADAIKQQLANANQMAIFGADLGQTASNGRTPQEQQAIYTMRLNQLEQTAPQLAKVYPKEFDDNTKMTLIKGGMDALIRQKEEEERKSNPSDTTKRINELNASREAAGQAPLSAAEKADLQKKGLDKSLAPAQSLTTPANQQVNVATTTDRLKETGKQANLAQSNINVFRQMEQLNDNALEGKGAENDMKFRQILTYFGVPVNKKTSATETFNSLVRQAQLNAQTMLKGSTSDRDMEIVSQTGPQLNNTKAGRRMMISAATYKATMDVQYNAFLNAYQNKNNGSLDGADESWNNFVQSRNDFNKSTLMFNSKNVTRKAWESFLDPNYTAPQQQQTQPASQNTNFQEGKVYQDANGNRAMYQNGQWVAQ